PCFDQPQFKTPWQVTLRIPGGDSAFSNTPVLSESAAAGGLKTVKFEETKPLPSYLVALAVGPLEAVNAGTAGSQHTPVRIITPKGYSSEAAYAAEVTPKILTMLEQYFGLPYPYQKLDNVAMPMVFGFGAMENAGLVTYAQTIILARPADDTIEFRRRYAVVCAHELAHQWFGDLVTPEWWNDIWLNESFATWMEQKIVNGWKPEWGVLDSDIIASQAAMVTDSLTSAREIRQPVVSENDIANAFDTITYEKGGAVIRMFEDWIGPEKFRNGVHLYLSQHAYGNATATDFLSAISRAAGRDVAPAFSTFLDQTGVPLVMISLKCDAKGPRLELSQQRYLPLGSKGSPARTWDIPVCVAYSAGGARGRDCTLLTQQSQEMALSAKSCPDWVLGNAGAAGYYRVLYVDGLGKKLYQRAAGGLSTAERIDVLGDARALMRGGEIPAGRELALVPEFSSEPGRYVVESTIDIADGIKAHLVPQKLEDNYERFVRRNYAARAEQVGWTPKPGEDDSVRLLRPRLVPFVARAGRDKKLVANADSLARGWLKDRSAVASEMVIPVLTTAAEFGGRDLFERYLAAARSETNLRDRERLVTALGSFRDPAIAKSAMDLILTGQFDPRMSFELLFGPLEYPETRALPFEFVKQNFDTLLSKLPRGATADSGAMLPMVAGSFCSLERRNEVEDFFKGRIADFPGGPRNLDQVLESITICTAVRKAQEASAAEFLARY
ncbi:MAG: ERAP1-like C-terminal domain-containing protein, partial [Acidobacteria bacterium]|nr:ERAP1-like C-terminal domain-containing protein [Acidobacteriota bacterium]